MKAANSPTKHHYIPAFYLRRWGGADGKVTEFSSPYRDIVVKPIMPERTGYQERLYELKGYEPELAQQAEEKVLQADRHLGVPTLSTCSSAMVTTRRGIRTAYLPGRASSFHCSALP